MLKNLVRLFDWIKGIVHINIEVLEKKEKTILDTIYMLTSSADFIKIVKSDNLEEAKKILALNVC
jgi:hypothetical protein